MKSQLKQVIIILMGAPILGYLVWDAYQTYQKGPRNTAPPPTTTTDQNSPTATDPSRAGQAATQPTAPGPRPPGSTPPPAAGGADGSGAGEDGEVLSEDQLRALGLGTSQEDPIAMQQEAAEKAGIKSDPFVDVPMPVVDPDKRVVERPVVETPKVEHDFKLTGLYLSWGNGFSAAYMDDAIVRVNDPVAEGWKVAEITETGVRLSKEGSDDRFVHKLSPLEVAKRAEAELAAKNAPPGAAPSGPTPPGVPLSNQGTNNSPTPTGLPIAPRPPAQGK